MPGFEFDGTATGAFGSLKLIQLEQDRGEVAVGVGEAGARQNGGLKFRSGLRKAPLFKQQGPKIAMRICIVRLDS